MQNFFCNRHLRIKFRIIGGKLDAIFRLNSMQDITRINP